MKGSLYVLFCIALVLVFCQNNAHAVVAECSGMAQAQRDAKKEADEKAKAERKAQEQKEHFVSEADKPQSDKKANATKTLGEIYSRNNLTKAYGFGGNKPGLDYKLGPTKPDFKINRPTFTSEKPDRNWLRTNNSSSGFSGNNNWQEKPKQIVVEIGNETFSFPADIRDWSNEDHIRLRTAINSNPGRFSLGEDSYITTGSGLTTLNEPEWLKEMHRMQQCLDVISTVYKDGKWTTTFRDNCNHEIYSGHEHELHSLFDERQEILMRIRILQNNQPSEYRIRTSRIVRNMQMGQTVPPGAPPKRPNSVR